MTKISAVRTVQALRHELELVGLKRTSGLNGADTRGWIEKNHLGSTGYSIRPLPDGTLDWHLVISGRPHMRYREYREIQDDETYSLHSPENPEVVIPKIRKAFAALGIDVVEAKCTGHQTMWDDDVDFNVTTRKPEWLADWDPCNREAATPFLPRLVSGETNLYSSPAPLAPTRGLPAYALGGGEFGLPREAVGFLVSKSPEYVGKPWAKYGEPSLQEDGSFVLERNGEAVVFKPRRIVNYWGDDVDVFVLPRKAFEPGVRYSSEVPVMVGGEVRVPDFPTLDQQFGDEAPWSPEQSAAPKP